MLIDNTDTDSEKRLNELYATYLRDQSIHELLVDGLNSIESNEYKNITKYAKWLRDIIIMVENIPISVSISSRESKNNITHPLVYVNKAFENMTQYSRKEVIGKNCNFLQGSQIEQEKNTLKEMAKMLETGKSCKILISNYKKDKSYFRNLLSLFPITYKSGEICYYMGLQCNISDPLTPLQSYYVIR